MLDALDQSRHHWRDRAAQAEHDARGAADVLAYCGMGRVLDVGSGLGGLVAQLLRSGCDAYGIDTSSDAIAASNAAMPGRFLCASALRLPFDDGAFPVVVCIDTLQYLSPPDALAALVEMRRVCSGTLLLGIGPEGVSAEQSLRPAQPRIWWEDTCLQAGFRKAPRHYTLNPYASIRDDALSFSLLLESVPAQCAAYGSGGAAGQAQEGEMDMLRQAGIRADAYVARYHWASYYIKPGDRVLDVNCGTGYGSFVVADLTAAASVIGLAGSSAAVDAAALAYQRLSDRVRYRSEPVLAALAQIADASFEAVAAFDHALSDDPAQLDVLLPEFHRVLTPGGRILISASSGAAARALEALFLPEHAFVLSADSSANASRRSLTQAAWLGESMQGEWRLMTAMKSPLAPGPIYQERVFQNVAQPGRSCVDYAASFENPWLMHSMVNAGYRLKDVSALNDLALSVVKTYGVRSCDYAAGACVRAYIALVSPSIHGPVAAITEIDHATLDIASSPMALRWRVSLLFVRAKLLETVGDLAAAAQTFSACAALDALGFSVHLTTKTTEAAFSAGRIHCAMGRLEQARDAWTRGLEIGSSLLRVDLDDILIDPLYPNLFNHGDGVREYSVAWDNIARCANGLHLLRRGGRMDHPLLNCSQQTEYAAVTRDLLLTRRDLVARTQTLEQVAATLVSRTERLEVSERDLVARTNELVETREALVARTKMLERTSQDLLIVSEEAASSRALVTAHTEALDRASADLQERTAELIELRATVVERTQMLERACAELLERTEDLVATRATLRERTLMLEASLHTPRTK